MKNIHCLFVTMLGAAMFVAPTADAASIGGRAGAPLYSSQWNCFGEASGGVVNTCDYAVTWEMPLYVTSSTSYYPTVYSSAGVSCGVYADNENGTLYSSTNPTYYASPPGEGGSFSAAPGGAFVPAQGYLYIACVLSQGSSIASVIW